MKRFKMKAEKGFGIAIAMRVLLVAGITIAFGSTVFAGECDWDGINPDCDIPYSFCGYETWVAHEACLHWCELDSGGFVSEDCVSSCDDAMANDSRHCDEENATCLSNYEQTHPSYCGDETISVD